jgi:hypothetical protein
MLFIGLVERPGRVILVGALDISIAACIIVFMTNTAASYAETADKRVNGQRHYKTTAMVGRRDYGPDVLLWRSYWRSTTSFAPGFNFKVTQHGR